jgi:hypothetical protein
MSTSTTPYKPAPPAERGKIRSFLAYIFLPHGKPGEIVIISHSSLFYWWPVWLVGFIMAILTYWDGHRLAVVPRGTNPIPNATVTFMDKDGEVHRMRNRDILMLDKDKKLLEKTDESGELQQPDDIRMASSKSFGIVYVVVLLLVIFITNVPLRGLWSLFIIIFILLLSIIFAQSGVWEALLNRTRLLAIHINPGGYLAISIALFVLWIVNFLFFDRQFYMIFTPGQVRVHLEIGAGETVYDTGGMVFQKQRSDLFRHWILGFGSGDLIVRPAGGAQHIDLPNVLSVGRRVKEIEKKLAEKEVVPA